MARTDANPPWIRVVVIVASFLCATTVWMAVKLTETKEQILEVPIVLANTVDQVEFTFEPTRARVKFAFSSKDSRLVTADNFRVVVEIPEALLNLDDLARRDEGELRFSTPLNRRMVEPMDPSLRPLVEPVEVLSSQTTWTARLRRHTARIVPTVSGTPAEGYDYVADATEFDRSPELTVVLNEESETRFGVPNAPPINLQTEPIDITGIRDEQRVLVRLNRTDNQTAESSRGPVAINIPDGVWLLPRDRGTEREVILRAVERQISRELTDVPVTHTFLRQGLTATIEPDTISVVLRGPTSAVNEVTRDMVSIRLNDVPDQPGTTARVSVSARLTDSDLRPLINVRPEPASVSITVESVEEPVVETPTPTPSPSPSPTPSPSPSPSPSPTPEISSDDEPTT